MSNLQTYYHFKLDFQKVDQHIFRYDWNYWLPRQRSLAWQPVVSVVTKYIISWWQHQMETFSALLALCAGNSLIWFRLFTIFCGHYFTMTEGGQVSPMFDCYHDKLL